MTMSAAVELFAAWSPVVDQAATHDRQTAARELGDDLVACYREPHRHYHTVDHLLWVTRHVTDLARSEPVDDIGATIVAGFFHDAVYDASRSDNERVSAEYAKRRLPELGWTPARIAHVASLVEATREHAVAPDAAFTHDASLLIDADLAVLGAEPAGYQAYVNGVRQEYRFVDDDAWRTGRARVLRSFLDRDRIYRTPTANVRWEHRARANVTAELSQLAPHANHG